MGAVANVVTLAAVAGALLVSSASDEAAREPVVRSCAPLTAVYRSSWTPELATDAPSWMYTRSGGAAFAGVDPVDPRASGYHLDLMEALARHCAHALEVAPVRADAFEREFELHRCAGHWAPYGLREVWWSRELALPLVIVREVAGRTVVDELVHLELEERSDVLARGDR